MEPLAAGTHVDRYVVEAVIGKGGMALVYRVRHRQLGTHYAMKVPTVLVVSVRDRLLQEGRLQATLQHPNVVNVSDVVSVDGQPGLVMELIRGPGLDRLLQQSRLSFDQVDVLAKGILAGVAAAHARGLVHRDLKPANIMIAVQPDALIPKVTDFGLAKILNSEPGAGAGSTRTGTMMGTPAYMAPEQVRDSKNIDARADIFALGAILYEMVSGRSAFARDDVFETVTAVANGNCTPIRDLCPDAPERMLLAIEGALRIDPAQRMPDITRLIAAWNGHEALPHENSGPWQTSLLKHWETDSPSTAETPDPSGDSWGAGGAKPTHERASATLGSFDSVGAESLAAREGTTIVAEATTVAPGRWPMAVLAVGAFVAIAVAVAVGVANIPVNAPIIEPGSASDPPKISTQTMPPQPAETNGATSEIAPTAPVGPTATPGEPTNSEPIKGPSVVPSRPVSKIQPTKPEPLHVPPLVEPPAGDPTFTAVPVAEPTRPEPPPQASATKSSMARVELGGTAQKAWLQSAEGNFQLPATVKPGTYRLTVVFDDGAPRDIDEITVSAGETRVIQCKAALIKCK